MCAMLARRALATSARGSGSGPTGAPLVRLGEALAEAKMRGTRVAIAGAEGHARGALPADVLPTSAESAYGVQGAMVDHLLKHQHSIAGWKLGATSPAARARLGFSLPFVAPIFALDLRRADVPLDVAPFTFLGVEAEWCFEMGATLAPRDDAPWTAAEVRAAVASVYPVIEVVGTRFEAQSMGGKFWVIADQGGAGAFLQGTHMRMTLAQWDALGLDAPVTMSVDNAEVARGCARDVLQSPVHALAWSVNFLNDSGVAVQKGQVVSTGTMTGLAPCPSSAVVSANFSGVGILSATITSRPVAHKR